jgi:hypothetical protein
MRIWDIREGRLIYTLHGHTGPTLAANFSQDGSFFASGGVDQLVMVWRSNLLGLGSAVTEEFPVDRCPRSFRETESVAAPHARGHGSRNGTGISHKVKTNYPPPSTKQPVPSPHAAHSRPTPPSPPGQRNRPSTAPPPQPRQPTDHLPQPTPPPFDRDQIPPALVGMMDHIIGQVSCSVSHLSLTLCLQLDIITRTLSILDNRLTLTEDRVSTFMAQSRGIVPIKSTLVSSSMVNEPRGQQHSAYHQHAHSNYEADLQEEGDEGEGQGEGGEGEYESYDEEDHQQESSGYESGEDQFGHDHDQSHDFTDAAA